MNIAWFFGELRIYCEVLETLFYIDETDARITREGWGHMRKCVTRLN